MKPFIFISDFDGTMTLKDFYGIILDDYIGEEGRKYYYDWKKNNKIGTEFLNKVFSWYTFSDEELEEVLNKIEVDSAVADLYDFVKEKGGDFLVLSAGFNFYIERTLKKQGLSHLTLITNPGVFENKIFVMRPDVTTPYYSPLYGVDKEKVVLENKKIYQKVFYAGDSEPDLKAALASDVIFAKGELKELLEVQDKEFYAFRNFKEVIDILDKEI